MWRNDNHITTFTFLILVEESYCLIMYSQYIYTDIKNYAYVFWYKTISA